MRVLMVPLIGLSNINSDSDFLIYKDLIKLTTKRGWFSYLVLPETARGVVEVEGNAEIIYLDMSPNFFDESMSMPVGLKELFNHRTGTKIFDLIITTRVGGSIIMQRNLTSFVSRNIVPCVIIEAMVRAWQRPNVTDQMLRAASYCTAHTWLLSEEERKRAMSIIKKHCSFSMVSKFVQNSLVLCTGIRTTVLQELMKDKKKEESFSLFFGARFSLEKRPEVMNELMEDFWCFGRGDKINVYVTTQTVGGRIIGKFENNIYKEFIKGCDRQTFVDTAAKCHLFVCSSQDESWPSGFWEQLYVIGIGIFPDKKWVRSNLPKEYPYIYKNKTEAAAMIRYIYENYTEALGKVSWMKEWIEKNANWYVTTEQFLDWIEKIPIESRKIGRGIKKLGEDLLQNLGNKFTLNDFLLAVKEKADSYDPFKLAKGKSWHPSPYELYRHLINNGFVDECKEPEPVLIKKEK